MSDPTFDLEAFLPYRLAVASAQVSRGFAAIYGPRFGLDRAEWRVLAHLAAQPDVSIRDLAARVDLGKPKLTRAVQRLEARGLVARKAHPKDRRLVRLHLTPPGTRMFAEIVPLATAYETRLRAELAAAPDLDTALSRLSRLSPPSPASGEDVT